MIKINLLAEKKKTKSKSKRPAAVAGQGMSAGQTLLLGLLLFLGIGIAGGWWWSLNGQINDWTTKHEEADQELERLAEIRKKGDAYKQQKELLAQKIDLITELKRRQEIPVHILDQISRNLPDFVWLDQMAAKNNKINITGKATTYQAVTNFYNNLSRSGLFDNVNLGRTFEGKDDVSFSLTCGFGEAEEERDEKKKSDKKRKKS